jgi:hypothetical protein
VLKLSTCILTRARRDAYALQTAVRRAGQNNTAISAMLNARLFLNEAWLQRIRRLKLISRVVPVIATPIFPLISVFSSIAIGVNPRQWEYLRNRFYAA